MIKVLVLFSTYKDMFSIYFNHDSGKDSWSFLQMYVPASAASFSARDLRQDFGLQRLVDTEVKED